MAGKKDIVEQALKLIAGGAKEAAPKAAIRAYHVSPHDFDVFKPSEFRGSTFFSSTPERAKRGAEAGRNEMVMETATELPPVNWRTYEVEIDPSWVKGLSLTPSENKWFESLPGKIVGDDALAEATKGIPPGMYWDDFYNEAPVAEGVYEYIKKPTPPSISYEDAISKNRDIYHRQWPHYAGAATDEKSSASRLNEQGMGGYLVQDEGGLSFAINDPRIVKILRKYANGGSVRQGYQTKGRVVGDIVDQALKLVAGKSKEVGPKALRYKNTPINAWHATEKPFTSYDWGLLGSATKSNVEGTGVEDWAMDLARVGPWSSEKRIDLGFGTHIPVTVGGKGKAFNSLDDLQRAIAKAGGPDKFRQNMTAKGFGHLRVADEEFGGTSYVSLTPETFTVRDDLIERASGGSIREGYGPGGWVDDVVKMAGKVISGEGEDAAESALRAFAETKLKTPKGKPMRLYHLTPGNFSEFSVSPENRSGPVVFLSPYADFQPAYHQAAERGPNDEITSIFKEGANVMPVYADVRNPLILDSYEKIKEAQTKYQSGDRGFPYFVKPEAKAAMEADGYDGIIFGGNDPAPYRSETSTEGWNPHIGFQRNREEEIIVFDPKKVKSAISNTGKYDFTDPDITKAGGGSTSKPQRSMGGNNSISGALNVARRMNGGK